jgi:ribonucleoside-diphosphate reductase beta chain
MNKFEGRGFYKPFDFPWAYDLYKKHESLHWIPEEVPMHEDVRDWNEKLTKDEKELLTHLFRFFTQSDVDVAAGYHQKFIPLFGKVPELAMMMGSFANREAVHIDAYSKLIETVGMPESTYKEFSKYREMKDKHEYLQRFTAGSSLGILKSLAAYAAFTEGLQLFGSFIVLLNFSRLNKMKNMGNLIAWSIRDENLHVEGMTRLFREYAFHVYQMEGHPGLEKELLPMAFKMVELEEAFIDLMFKDRTVEGLTAKEVKGFIHHLANQRWKQLGFNTDIYTIIKNPLPWVNYMVYGEEHTNFFEAKSTAYSKGMTQGTMDEIDW